VCSHIRRHPTLNATPVILLVGAFDAFDEETARQAGATANITKPFEPGALIELVTSVLTESEEPEIAPEPKPEPKPAAQPSHGREPAREPAREREPAVQAVSTPAAAEVAPVEDDLLGLGAIFREEPAAVPGVMSNADLDRIADRVIQKLSAQVIESIAWDIVPDITERIVREELKRMDEG
jgi:hypothetical protein